MKITLATALALVLSGYASVCLNPGPYAFTAPTTRTAAVDSTLFDIQHKVEQALAQAMAEQRPAALDNLRKQLTATEHPAAPATYWTAYVDYYRSVYYLFREDTERSQVAIQRGLDALKEKDDKDSEEYALLAIMESFSIMFSPGMKAAFISAKVQEHAHAAIELDSNNVRAYYALANNDFYTPKMYGGGRKVEQYLREAITLPERTSDAPYAPSWGLDQCYALLVRFYLKRKDTAAAREYYQEAIARYPESDELKSIQEHL